MNDIAPELLDQIRKTFLRLLGDTTVENMNYVSAGDYAEKVGAALAEAFHLHLTPDILPDGKMYWNVADRVIRPMLEQDHEIVADATVMVQQALNKAAGIGLKAQKAPLDEDKVSGILNKVSKAEKFEDVTWVLDEPIKTFSRAVVDDTLRRNVEFQGKAGLRPKIIRRAEARCCEWCSRLEGVYDYPDVPDGVYRRHKCCRCSVDYDPGDGRRQNVHTKQWKSQEKDAILEKRKRFGLTENVDQPELEDFLLEYGAVSETDKLPNWREAEIPSQKLSGYALNMNHPTGHHKAIVFRDALGYTDANEEELKASLYDGLSKWKATQRPETVHGQAYEVNMIITGSNGKRAQVTSGWMIDKGKSNPRLVTVYVKKKK